MPSFLAAARGNPVSVVIPVYNSGESAAEAIESVYAQTLGPREVIVVDDGSTDDTPLRLRQFEGRPGFVMVRQMNQGEASARNAGVERASGDYVAFLDHDDVWRPEKLEHQLAQFDPDWGMSFTAYDLTTSSGTSEVVGQDGWDPDPMAVLRALERSPQLRTCSTWLVRRDVLSQVGPFEQVWPFGTEWLLGLRLASAGIKVGYVPEPLTEYRLHGTNLSLDEDGRFRDAACAVSDLYGDSRMRAWHRLVTAVYAHERGDRRQARQRILQAARIRPLSIRPGWVRFLF